MVLEMSYRTVDNVIDSWETLRRMPGYEEKAGMSIFRKGIDKPDDALMETRLVREHAKRYVRMVDRAVDMLGPDVELLTEILLDLGVSHSRFGVEASFYPPMGQALISTLEEMLGEDFTTEKKDSWLECYAALSYDMMRAKNLKRE
eukprot:scaffold1319_cov126-Cylindrotheca_fusiformis.AAC.21